MEHEALDVPGEADFQDAARDNGCVEEVVMSLPAHVRGQNDVAVIQSVRHDLCEEPELGDDKAEWSGLIIEPLTDLAGDNDTLDRCEVVATSGEGQVELEQVEIVVFPELFGGHLHSHAFGRPKDGHTLNGAVRQSTLLDLEHAFHKAVLYHVGEIAVILNAMVGWVQGLWVPLLVSSVVFAQSWHKRGLIRNISLF